MYPSSVKIHLPPRVRTIEKHPTTENSSNFHGIRNTPEMVSVVDKVCLQPILNERCTPAEHPVSITLRYEFAALEPKGVSSALRSLQGAIKGTRKSSNSPQHGPPQSERTGVAGTPGRDRR